MAGTREGGIKARDANLKNHGPNLYRDIGRRGGRNGTTGGFAADPILAREAGAKGGAISRRRRADESEEDYEKRLNEARRQFAKR